MERLVLLVSLASLCVGQTINCISRNGNKKNGETWTEGQFSKRCIVSANGWRIDITDCLTKQGSLVAVNSQLVENEILYQCTQNGSTVYLQTRPALNASCTDQNGQKHAFGSLWTIGSFQYKCSEQGQYVVNACVTNKGNLVTVGTKFTQHPYVVFCSRKDNSYHISYEPMAQRDCKDSSGQTRKYQSSWIGGFNFNKTCAESGSIEISNCLSDAGTPVAINASIRENGLVFKCIGMAGGWVRFEYSFDRAADCLDSKYKTHPIGSTWKHGKYMLQCYLEQEIRVIGCLDNEGNMVGKDKLFLEGTIVRQCTKNGRNWQTPRVGCIKDPNKDINIKGNLVEIGERWTEGDSEMVCGWEGMRPYGCQLIHNGESRLLPVGSWWQIENMLKICHNINNKAVLEEVENDGKQCMSNSNSSALYVGQTKTAAGIVSECKFDSNEKLKLVDIGCAGPNGQIATPSHKFELEDRLYLCASDGTIHPEVIGCTVPNGGKVNIGETFQDYGRDGWELVQMECAEKEDVFKGCLFQNKVIEVSEKMKYATKMLQCSRKKSLKISGCLIGDFEVERRFNGIHKNANWSCNSNCRCKFTGCASAGGEKHPEKYLTNVDKTNQRLLEQIHVFCGAEKHIETEEKQIEHEGKQIENEEKQLEKEEEEEIEKEKNVGTAEEKEMSQKNDKLEEMEMDKTFMHGDLILTGIEAAT